MQKSSFYSLYSTVLVITLSWATVATEVFAGNYLISQEANVTSATEPVKNNEIDDSSIDYQNAMPMPMPTLPEPSSPLLLNSRKLPKAEPASETPASSPGSMGSGKEMPAEVPKSEYLNLNRKDGAVLQTTSAQSIAPEPQDFGSFAHPFTTARVTNFLSATKPDKTFKSYPYRAAGKLFFNIGSDTYVCSAALIKPGIIVTAAHCVIEFGTRTGFYSNWVFIPAYNIGKAPYGKWYGFSPSVLSSYANGTDACATGNAGIVCQNDVAVIAVANKKLKKFPGDRTGWFGYAWNGTGFTKSFPGFPDGLTQISQLGYPASHDAGQLMQRNDSFGYTVTTFANNTIIGSLMTGGSSGGPWIINLGIRPALSGTAFGLASAPNTIVGVTSWGASDTSVKIQGASPFTSANIVLLVNSICSKSNVPRGACS